MSYWSEMLGGQVRHIRVGEVDTRLLEAGTDKQRVVLLIHGAGGHAENFVTNVVPLSAAGHVVAPDLLGHGMNSRVPGAVYTLRAVIDHVKKLIDVLGAERVDVVGLSLGGMIAAHVARECKTRVGRLVLICPVGFAPDAASEAEFHRSTKDVVENNIAGFADGEAAIRKKITMLVHDPKNFPEEMIAARIAMYARPGAKEAMAAVLRDLYEARNDYIVNERVLREIDAETLFVWGRKNFGSLAVIEQSSKTVKRGTLKIMEESGHWPHVVEREAFHRLVLEFLGG
jgi:pimeloyl-ACP methyl ester carboxylesterase